MQNPYEPPVDTKVSSPAKWSLRECFIIAALVGLAAHGAVTILVDTGYLIRDGKQYRLWCEAEVR
jgi:hypothetical protein